MASVWAAQDELLGRLVAVKVLAAGYAQDERANRRFLREARAGARLSDCRHVVTVYDIGEHDGRPFMVMEHFSGGTVADRLRSRREIPRALALRWLREAAEALDCAHRHDVVHRDVKPANLLIDERGRLAVGDFGIATVAAEASLTQTGQVLGTAAYISPEQARGHAATDASDRYALAVVAFELLDRPPALHRRPSGGAGPRPRGGHGAVGQRGRRPAGRGRSRAAGGHGQGAHGAPGYGGGLPRRPRGRHRRRPGAGHRADRGHRPCRDPTAPAHTTGPRRAARPTAPLARHRGAGRHRARGRRGHRHRRRDGQRQPCAVRDRQAHHERRKEPIHGHDEDQGGADARHDPGRRPRRSRPRPRRRRRPSRPRRSRPPPARRPRPTIRSPSTTRASRSSARASPPTPSPRCSARSTPSAPRTARATSATRTRSSTWATRCA